MNIHSAFGTADFLSIVLLVLSLDRTSCVTASFNSSNVFHWCPFSGKRWKKKALASIHYKFLQFEINSDISKYFKNIYFLYMLRTLLENVWKSSKQITSRPDTSGKFTKHLLSPESCSNLRFHQRGRCSCSFPLVLVHSLKATGEWSPLVINERRRSRRNHPTTDKEWR